MATMERIIMEPQKWQSQFPQLFGLQRAWEEVMSWEQDEVMSESDVLLCFVPSYALP